MRLFTGIALAPSLVENLAAIVAQLRPFANIKWSPSENLHITCKFIGEWPDDRLPDLKTALTTVPATSPIAIVLSGFGFLPNPRQPHSFFAGVEAGPALAELAAAIDRALLPLGCASEDRPWFAHVTLARIKRGRNILALRRHIADMTDLHFGAFDATNFHLYQSKPSHSGSVYIKLATYDLMRENNAIS